MNENQKRYVTSALKSYATDLEWIADDVKDGHVLSLGQLRDKIEYVLNKLKKEIEVFSEEKKTGMWP
jgi:hypothetical protein